MELRYQDLPPAGDVPDVGINRCYTYLAERGIDKQDIEALGVSILRAIDLGRRDDDRAAIVFPHRSATGALLEWWSARLVDIQPPVGWAAMVPKARPKMMCPAKCPPSAYLVPTLDWGNIPHGSVIYIHESCIKAANGAKCGKYSVGLNGVWGWGSKAHQIALLDEIKDLPWKAKGLHCVVVFDSDAATNDGVSLAIQRFAERMRLICKVEVKQLDVPTPPSSYEAKRWGFDDYCAFLGLKAGIEFLDGWEKAPVAEMGELELMRLQLNNEVVLVRNIKKIVEQESGTLMTKAEFADVNYAHYVIADEEGKQTSAPKSWMTWRSRREVSRLEYTPGGPPIEGSQYLNLWRGMGTEPCAGDVTPWLDLLTFAVPDADLRQWVIRWFAYPLQNLGAKLNSYIHMFGPGGGGKNALLTPIIGIYGENAVSLGRERIVSDFNEIYARTQFLNIDELHGGNDQHGLGVAQKIKMLTTAPKLAVNAKGVSECYVDNHVNLVTTGNYADGLRLDAGDRRALVLKVGSPSTIIKDGDYWQRYFAWANSPEGQAALYAYLLTVDMGDFNAHGWAPNTVHKEDITEATMTPMESWTRDLLEDPELVLDAAHCAAPALTVEALALQMVGEDMALKVTQMLKNRLGTALRDAGFSRTGNVRVGETYMRRLWILSPSLKGASDTEVRDVYVAWKGKSDLSRKF